MSALALGRLGDSPLMDGKGCTPILGIQKRSGRVREGVLRRDQPGWGDRKVREDQKI